MIKNIDQWDKMSELKYYHPVWENKNTNLVKKNNFFVKQNVWLIFENDYGFGVKVGNILEKSFQKIIYVKTTYDHKTCCFIDDKQILLNPFNEKSYAELTEWLSSNNLIPDYILHFWGCIVGDGNFNVNNFNEAQYFGFYSLFFLNKFFLSNVIQKKYLVSFSINQFNVTANEKINPQMSPMLGAIRVIPKENINISTLHVDLANLENTLNNADCESILAKICDLKISGFEICALRRGIIFTQNYENTSLSNNISTTKEVKEVFVNRGVYLITGGLGGLGLALAKHISTKVNAIIILVSRREFPKKDDWHKLSAKNIKEKNIISKLDEIEKTGSKIFLYKCDIAHPENVKSLFKTISSNFQSLDGIIHSAGVAAKHIKYEKNIDTIVDVLNPKLPGTLNLIKYSKRFKINFMVLCSSLASVIGAFGNIEYCAANAYLDTIAQLNLTHIKKIVSINWNQIYDVGMAVDCIDSCGNSKISENSISSAMAAEILEKSIIGNLNQLIISKESIFSLIDYVF